MIAKLRNALERRSLRRSVRICSAASIDWLTYADHQQLGSKQWKYAMQQARHYSMSAFVLARQFRNLA